MSRGTLFDKVWDAHTVGTLPSGQTQLFIGLHLIHEVTSPQAFAMLRERGLPVLFPDRTIATVDHIVPTEIQARPFVDALAERFAFGQQFAFGVVGFVGKHERGSTINGLIVNDLVFEQGRRFVFFIVAGQLKFQPFLKGKVATAILRLKRNRAR